MHARVTRPEHVAGPSATHGGFEATLNFLKQLPARTDVDELIRTALSINITNTELEAYADAYNLQTR